MIKRFMYNKKGKHSLNENIAKSKIWRNLLILLILTFVIIPVTFGKYTSTFSVPITLNIRKPEYTVNFISNINNNLPEGYYNLEYIESSGNQYIDTGVQANNGNLSFEIQYAWSKLPNAGQYANVFASYESEEHVTTRIIQYGTSTTYYNINSKAGGGSGVHTGTRTIDTVYTEYLSATEDNVITYISNGKKNTFTGSSGIDSSNKIYICSSSQGRAKASIKLYYFKIYNNGELIRDFVPCSKLIDNVEAVGLYDVVNNMFYESIGEEEFIKPMKPQKFIYGTAQNLIKNQLKNEVQGFVKWNTKPDGSGISYLDEQEVNNLSSIDGDIINLYAVWTRNKMTYVFHPNKYNLPDGYYGIEYIESSGNQYIDTGVQGNNSNLSLDIQYEWAKVPETNNYDYVLGSYQSEDHVTTRILQYGPSITYYNINCKAGSSKSHNNTREEGTIYNESLASNGTTVTYTSNGITSTLDGKSGSDTTNNIYVFSASNGRAPSSIRLYHLKIYDNNVLIRDFAPCYKETDGIETIGLYDTVNNKFYENIGKDHFVETIKNQSIFYSSTDKLSKNTFNNPGYVFTGWNTKPDGTGTSYTDEQVITNNSEENATIRLFAQWENMGETE